VLPKRDIAYIKKDAETPKTQLVIVTGFLVIAAILDSNIIAYLALIIGVICIAIPAAGNWIVWAWYKLAEVLSKITTPLILSLLYYLFITPIALLFRAFGNDPLRLKDSKGSMFELRNKKFTKNDLENPW